MKKSVSTLFLISLLAFFTSCSKSSSCSCGPEIDDDLCVSDSDSLQNENDSISGNDSDKIENENETENDNPPANEGDAVEDIDITGDIITPDEPQNTEITFKIDVTKEQKAISPYIYGTNIFGVDSWVGGAHNLPFGRLGGNRWTAYNWENNASNAGNDWNYQNDAYLGGGDEAGNAAGSRIATIQADGASALVTIPIQGFVAADKNGDGDVRNSSNHLQTRFEKSLPRKSGELSTNPDTSDDSVYQDEFVNWIKTNYGNKGKIFFSLDNEPDLWNSTHPEIHPEAVSYAELIKDNSDYGCMIKDVFPESSVFGFVSYGFNGFVNLQDASDAGGRFFIDYYLAEMKKAEESCGKRVVDVMDLHWYPEVYGGETRITEEAIDFAVAEARIQSPRSLWDKDYSENSWISNDYLNGPIALLPFIQEKIDANYEGTKLAFSEYYYGGGDHISGAIAQADVLGIFAKYGVFAANLWPNADVPGNYIYGAFDIFRNYDGNKSSWGDVAVSAENPSPEEASVYASIKSSDPSQTFVVIINKKTSSLKTGIAITHSATYKTASVYSISESSCKPTQQSDITTETTNSFIFDAPAMTISILVFKN